MGVERAADRAVFVNPDEFGEEIVWTVGEVPSTLSGLPDTGTLRFDTADGAGALDAHATLLCRSADVPAGGAAGDAVTFRAAAHTVKSIEPDGTGMCLVRLELVIDDDLPEGDD